MAPRQLKSGVSSNSSSPSAIVIGGGMAGIAAARALQKTSFKVTVLESQDRIGGRIRTDYSFGFPVDMGASWLHGACQRNPLAPLIGRLELPLYRTSGDDSVLFDHDLESYALFDMDGRKVPQELVTEVGEIFKMLLEESNKVTEEFEEDISLLKSFTIVWERRPDLRLNGLAYKVLQWYMCRMEGWFATDIDSISARSWTEEELLDGGHGLMVRGYYPVIQALSKGLDIRLKHRVTKVIRGYNGVKVVTDDGKLFIADAVVIALPLGVLKANLVKFEPRLPKWKEAAIADLGVGNENKIALFFNEVCWPNVEFLGIVAPTTYGCSYFLNLHKATGHPVLVYMPAGRLADDIEKTSDAEAVNFAMLQLKRILPHVSQPIRSLVSHWGTDINSLGCYSHDSVGKPHDLYERMRIPVDNLFFAGEATSTNFPGMVHGAFATGILAAGECKRHLLEKYSDLNLFQPVMGEELITEPTPLLISRM